MEESKRKVDYSLYLCTDRRLMTSSSIEECVEHAIQGGVTIVQLREKDCSSREFYELALRVKRVTKQYQVPLIINDRVDIALAADADGVHVGQKDLPCQEVRRLVGEKKIVGVSAANRTAALQAAADGADYIGVGAVFATGTKQDAVVIAPEELAAIRQAVSIPMVAIGGIQKQTLPLLKGTGIDGVAVISAIVAQPDVEQAARELKELWNTL